MGHPMVTGAAAHRPMKWAQTSWLRLAGVALAIAIAGFIVAEAVVLAMVDPTAYGLDFRYYEWMGDRWLADGAYYWPHQLAGSYDFTIMVDVLYPPTALLLFVPAAVLPPVLWWAVPIALLGYVIHGFRPGPWAWVAMLLLLAWPRALSAFVMGNTDLWAAAGLAAGFRWGWPAILLTMKPTLAPFALLVVRRRSFWSGAAVLSVVSLAMLPLWFDYVTAMRNLRIGVDYSLGSIPLMLVPVVAWLARVPKHPHPAAVTTAGVDRV